MERRLPIKIEKIVTPLGSKGIVTNDGGFDYGVAKPVQHVRPILPLSQPVKPIGAETDGSLDFIVRR